jgi:hypothetical protein
MQKVPLPTDRDNVPPAYLRDVRVAVLNACFDLLSDADTRRRAWVSNAMEDENVDAGGGQGGVHWQVRGEDRDLRPERSGGQQDRAMEQGYTVVPGGALPKAAWSNVKGGSIALPAGQVTPSPNPNEDDANMKLMDPDHYPEPSQRRGVLARRSRTSGLLLDGCDVEVRVANDDDVAVRATYGPRKGGRTGQLTLNLGRLGHKWFEQVTIEDTSTC